MEWQVLQNRNGYWSPSQSRAENNSQQKHNANKEDQKTQKWSAGCGKRKKQKQVVPPAQGKKSIQTLH